MAQSEVAMQQARKRGLKVLDYSQPGYPGFRVGTPVLNENDEFINYGVGETVEAALADFDARQAKLAETPTKTVCAECGVKTVEWTEKRGDQVVLHQRDYMPVTFVIQLKPDVNTTYIVSPGIERLAVHIQSLDNGKLHYAVDIPLPEDETVQNLLDADERIEKWHTEESAVVCPKHVNFIKTVRA